MTAKSRGSSGPGEGGVLMSRFNNPASHELREAAAQKRGLVVLLVLGLLTGVEYAVAVSLDSTVALVLLISASALGKCWAISLYFMHVYRLWRGEEAHS